MYSAVIARRPRSSLAASAAFLVPLVCSTVSCNMPSSAYSEREVIIGDSPSEGLVGIRFDVVATLTIPEGEGGFGGIPRPSVARLINGDYVAGAVLGGASPLGIFRPSGTYERGYGRSGEGPAEFTPSMPVFLIHSSPTGTPYVFNGLDIHELGVAIDGTVSKKRGNVFPHDVAVLSNTTVVQALVRTPMGGTVLQILDEMGRAAWGMDSIDEDALEVGRGFDSFRRIAPSRDGAGVWSARINRYDVSLFDLEGDKLVRIVRDTPWFRPYEDLIAGELWFVPQRPRIEDLVEAPDGLLWIISSRGAKDFTPMASLPTTSTGGDVLLDPYLNLNDFVDSTIEVLDPTLGVVRARAETEELMHFVNTANGEVQFYTLRNADDGSLVIDILSAALR